MRPFMFGLGLFFFVVLVGVGIPLMKRKLESSHVAGIWTPEEYSNPELWEETKEYHGRLMVQFGLALGLLSLLYFVPSISDVVYEVVITIAIGFGLLVIFRKTSSYAKTIARDKHIELSKPKADPDWNASLRVVGLVLVILASVFFMAISIPLALGQVGPNPTYGLRVPETLNNPDIWYSVNAHSGLLHIAANVFVILLMIGLYFVRRISDAVYLMICLLAFTVAQLAACLLPQAYLLFGG